MFRKLFPSLAGYCVPWEGGHWGIPLLPLLCLHSSSQEMLSTGSPLMSIARVLPILITLHGLSRQEKFPRKALGRLRSEEDE